MLSHLIQLSIITSTIWFLFLSQELIIIISVLFLLLHCFLKKIFLIIHLLLKAFTSIYPQEPCYIVTDQGVAMKQTVEGVFKTARHRLCMWHIMKKLPNKLGSVNVEAGFRARLHSLVWND